MFKLCKSSHFSVLERLSSSEIVPALQAQAAFFGAKSTELYEPWPPVEALHLTWNFLADFGLPWWSVIAGSALGFRLLTLPLQQKFLLEIRTKREALSEFEPARMAIAESVMRGDRSLAKSQLLEYAEILKSRGLSGLSRGNKLMLFLNAGWFFTFSASLRGLVVHPDTLPSFALKSGLLWMPSLALADPLGILPVLSSISYMAALECREEFQSHPQKEKMRLIFRGVTFLVLPIVTHLPAAFYFFMATNAAFNAWFGLRMRTR